MLFRYLFRKLPYPWLKAKVLRHYNTKYNQQAGLELRIASLICIFCINVKNVARQQQANRYIVCAKETGSLVCGKKTAVA